MNGETAAATPAGRAFIALAAHCSGCADCRPNPEASAAERPDCPQAAELYRVWNRLWRMERCRGH